MKLILSIITIIMLVSLAGYSVINLFVSPAWMLAMIAYSMFFIYMIAKDMKSKKEVA